MTETTGYVDNIAYTYGYYREINPNLLKMACLAAGAAPQLRDELSYLELGFGQGLSINIHAAATRGSFWGTDFNPEHAANARQLAAETDASLHLFDESFSEFLARPDTPDFDIIALHGIWSWVSDASRETIIEIIRTRLRAGGIVYISYNCLPGWAPAIPLRHLLRLYQDYAAGQMSDPRLIIEGALKFSEDVFSKDIMLARENPAMVHHLKSLKNHQVNYLAHEYMNKDWHLVNFSEMIEALKETKLHFVGSARLLDRVDGLNLTKDAQAFIGSIPNPVLRESIRDYMVNQRFRQDVFVKGPRQMSMREQREAWHAQRFILTICLEDIPKSIKSPLGQAQLPTHLYDPVIEALADDDYRPKTIPELLADPRLKALQEQQVGEALIVLAGVGALGPAQEPDPDSLARCQALNASICDRARVSMDIGSLASPVTGGGIAVPHICQLFLRATRDGLRSPEELADEVWAFLSSIDKKLEKDGKQIESEEEAIAEVRKMSAIFVKSVWPLLRALRVC